MKQTLFEAEAVISVNTDKMFSDLDKAAREAKRRLQDALGGLSVPTLGGGRGGGSSGGGRTGGIYAAHMALAQGEKAAGKYGDAIQRLTDLITKYNLSNTQTIRAHNLIESVERKRLSVTAEMVRLKEKQALAEEKAARKASTAVIGAGRVPTGAYGNTGAATTAMFQQEMALSRAEKAAMDYSGAIARLTALTNNNRLSTIQNAQAQTALTMALRKQEEITTKASSKGGGTQSAVNPDLRRRNAQIQNASFAVQDFITVLSMGGGWTRALASASNNLAFMMAMIGTTGGAIAGFAVTLGAVLVPALLKAAMGIEDMGDKAGDAAKRVDELNERLRETREGMSFWEGIGEKFQFGDIAGIQKELDAAMSEKRKLTADLEAGRQFRTSETPIAAQEFEDAVGVNAKFIGEKWLKALREGMVSSADVEKIVADTDWTDTLMGTRGNWEALAQRLKDIEAPSDKAASALNLLQFKIANLGYAAEEAARNRLDKPLFTQDELDRSDAEQRRKGMPTREEIISGYESRRSAIQDISDMYDPNASRIRDINKTFGEVMSKYSITDPEGAKMLGGLGAMKDEQIKKLTEKNRPSISGQMSGGAFAQQLTNQLLQKDPNKELLKVSKEQKEVLDRLAGEDNAIVQAIKDLTTNTFTNK